LKLSLSNGMFSEYTLSENIALIRKLGFKNLEFNMKCMEEEDEEAVYPAKQLIDKYELNCLTLHAATIPVNSEAEIPKAIYYGKVSADFAHVLSAPTMVIHSNISRRPPKSLRKRFLKRIFRELILHTKHLGIKLAIENLSHESRSFGENIAEIQEVLSIVDDNDIGLTIDFCHAITTGQTFSLIEKYKNLIYNIHVSNKGHKQFESENPLLKAFLVRLVKCGYNGPLTIELDQKCTLKHILKTRKIVEEILKNIQ
jgi:sugar phosphate isomerase/epimerase